MADTPLFTYQDTVNHLSNEFDIDLSARSLNLMKRAVLTTILKFPTLISWSYYKRRGSMVTVANQETGTVVYDHTGGTNERQLTLTGATWPSWAQYGRIIMNSDRFKVEKRVSDTVITLTSDSNPGADITTATTYDIHRAVYPFPTLARTFTAFGEVTQSFVLGYLTPEQMLYTSIGWYQPQRPDYFTFRSAGDFYGGMEIEFHPPPNTIRNYDFFYEAAARPLRVYKYNTGTVSVTAGSTTVTGSGTAFDATHRGSIIRFTTGTTEPTDLAGGGIGDTDNPYFAQRVVSSVESGTSLTIDAAVSATTAISAKKFTISDPIDIEPLAMWECWLRWVELEFARRTQSDDLPIRDQAARQSLREAAGADVRKGIGMGGGNDQSGWGLEDWQRFPSQSNSQGAAI